MAMTIYMSITGKSQGDIKAKSEMRSNSNEHPERRDRILVYEFNHMTASEVSSSTGIPEGGSGDYYQSPKGRMLPLQNYFNYVVNANYVSWNCFFFALLMQKMKFIIVIS